MTGEPIAAGLRRTSRYARRSRHHGGLACELPRIKHRRAYLEGLGALPDWRITCFFVDGGHRRSGVASAALEGALDEIARLGGGTVES